MDVVRTAAPAVEMAEAAVLLRVRRKMHARYALLLITYVQHVRSALYLEIKRMKFPTY